MKFLINVFFLCAFSVGVAHAQSNEDRARAYYAEAQAAYTNKKYRECLSTLDKVESLLGQKTAIVEALRVKAHFDRAWPIEDYYDSVSYGDAQKHLESFFKIKNTSEELRQEMQTYLVKLDKKKERNEEVIKMIESHKIVWERVKSINTIEGWQTYLQQCKKNNWEGWWNIKERNEAEKYISEYEKNEKLKKLFMPDGMIGKWVSELGFTYIIFRNSYNNYLLRVIQDDGSAGLNKFGGYEELPLFWRGTKFERSEKFRMETPYPEPVVYFIVNGVLTVYYPRKVYSGSKGNSIKYTKIEYTPVSNDYIFRGNN